MPLALRQDTVGIRTALAFRAAEPGTQWWALAVFVAAVVAVAAVGALAANNAKDVYPRLRRPAWAPPAWLFGPAWTILYITIALAGWIGWRHGAGASALGVYAAQLLINAAWTPLFFGLNRYGLALGDIVLLWLLIGATVALFWPVSPLAALLLLPYWAWVSYATALNASIWRLNR